MSTQKVVLLSVVGVLLLVGVVLVAFLLPGEHITRGIAVVGLLLTLGKGAYDIFNSERERRKKAGDSAEKVKATPDIDDHGYLCVQLYNYGSTLVHISRVALVVKEETGQVYRQLITNERSVRTTNSRVYLGESDDTVKLDIKDNAYFTLRYGGDKFKLAALHNLPYESLWIVVESYSSGEITRVPGDAIQAAIKTGLAKFEKK